jgi:outer membrane protein OmpA-like peptidoglycan-associated protein
MRRRLLISSLQVAASWCGLAASLLVGDVGAQWTVTMRAMRNPLPVGQCTAVEIVVMDAQGRQGPLRPDGKQVGGWDFDFAVTASAPDAFRLQNDDATRPFICAQAPTAASATFVAHYPGRQLKPSQVVPGIEVRQSIEVMLEGGNTASSGYPVNPPAGGYAGGGYPQGDPAQGSAYPQGSGYPQPSANAPASGYPQTAGNQPSAYPQSSGSPQAPSYPQSGYSQPGYQQPAGYPPAAPQQQVTGGAGPAPDSGVRSAKQFWQRIAGHTKHKAAEVASSTTTQLADAAGDVVGTTLETGANVVTSGAGSVTGAASAGVQEAGRSLGAAPTSKDPADVAAALATGRAVLYGLRFTEGTAMLEPSSGSLISQIAAALSRTPGQFLIETHVDGKNGAAAQALSEQRAAAVKAALVAAGSSPMQLAAVGYGASRPTPGAKSSARVEIARAQ